MIETFVGALIEHRKSSQIVYFNLTAIAI